MLKPVTRAPISTSPEQQPPRLPEPPELLGRPVAESGEALVVVGFEPDRVASAAKELLGRN